MSDELVVRRYRPEDASAVKRLHAAAMRDAGTFTEGVDDADLDAVEEMYLSDGEFLVGAVDSDLVAMGAYRPLDGGTEPLFEDLPDATAELKRMRVAPDHQRRGFGKRVYDELEDRAREAGFRTLVLDTTPAQTAAQRFYEANGFVHERDADVTFAGERLTLRLYRKRLD
ncbi:GNAT family N-acetyltransferase [Halorarius litoreus]|uniref:GNAT family N-acetyltransferase n=1 Tax=Halorarius litoreus TaxID=2962676 RepID=UPI0020CE543F|nr:GNAT family N-acetyltransferase [Halorarius litoreus]